MVPAFRAYISTRSPSMDMIDVLDSNGDPTGEVLSRKEVHRLGKLHRAVHLYLFNKENKLLLQRRSASADHYPSMFSISVTGHVDAGESSLEAVKRELKEELGLNSNNEDFKLLFSSRREAELGPTYMDRQINDVYACWLDFDVQNIAFDRTDVSEVKCISLSNFEKMVESGVEDIVPVYGDDLKRVVPLVQEIIKFSPPN
jgi:isopentenyl-diphosphate Delta-isomerase